MLRDSEYLMSEFDDHDSWNLQKLISSDRMKVWWRCSLCEVRWQDTPRGRCEFLRNCPNGCMPEFEHPISDMRPDLAERLVRQADAPFVFFDDRLEYEWACDCGKIIVAAPRHAMTSVSRCVECRSQGIRKFKSVAEEGMEKLLPPEMSQHLANDGIEVDATCPRGHLVRMKLNVLRKKFLKGATFCQECIRASRVSLAEAFPTVAAELTDNNPRSASEYSRSSWDEVEWKCSDCGFIYRASIANRTSHGSGCPSCYKRSGATSRLEQSIRSEIAAILGEEISGSTTVVTRKSDYRHRAFLDMCTHDRIGVEYDSRYWHRDRERRDRERVVDLENHGYRIISIREKGLSPVGSRTVEYDPSCDTISDVATRVTEMIRDMRGHQA